MNEGITYGHTGDLSILHSLQKDAQNGFNAPSPKKRVQVNAGGGQLNALSAGGVRPFIEQGLLPGFHFIFAGSSAGANALVAKGLMAEQVTDERMDQVVGIYYRDNVNNGLVTKNGRLPHFDIDTLEQTIRSKGLDVEAVRHLKPDVLVPLTYPDGKTIVMNAKDHPDPIALVSDGMAAPLVSQRSLRSAYHDGSFKNPLPLRWAIDQGATEIVSFLTDPIQLPFKQVLLNRIGEAVGHYMLRGRLADYQTNVGKLRSFLLYQREYLKELKLLKDPSLRPGVEILAFHPVDLAGHDMFCMHGEALKQGSDTATAYVRTALAQAA